jgi:integrase
VIDLYNLKEVVADRVEYYRAKTHRFYSIKVEPEAMEIIDRYRGTENLLCIRDTYKDYRNYTKHINDALKKIGAVERKGLGGKKIITPLFPKLSTYWARHTWATIAASLDIPKETIAHALGHGSTTVTDIYIDFDMKKVDDANRKVINYVLYGDVNGEKKDK